MRHSEPVDVEHFEAKLWLFVGCIWPSGHQHVNPMDDLAQICIIFLR